MILNTKNLMAASVFIASTSISIMAQGAAGSPQRMPSKAIRPVVVLQAQALDDLEKKLHPANKVEELIDSDGMQLRVAVQHEKNAQAASGEVHDASDDIYYVLEGSATLTMGGTLEAPREVEPGEWRGPHIVGGQQYEVKKGDLIIVPRGTPHQRSTIGQDFSMILIKVYREPRHLARPKTDGKIVDWMHTLRQNRGAVATGSIWGAHRERLHHKTLDYETCVLVDGSAR